MDGTVGVKYDSLGRLDGQALAWCDEANARVHGTTDEIPFDRLKKEALNPLSRAYTIDRVNLRRVRKDCLVRYAGSQYPVPAEYVGKDAAVVAPDTGVPGNPQDFRGGNLLAAYHEGKQTAVHRLSYSKKDTAVNPSHCQSIKIRERGDIENTLFSESDALDAPLKTVDPRRYDEAPVRANS